MMNELIFKNIHVFDSFIYFIYSLDGIDKKMQLSFTFDKINAIKLHFNQENIFLKSFKFNHLNLDHFITQIIHNQTLPLFTLVNEQYIPF